MCQSKVCFILRGPFSSSEPVVSWSRGLGLGFLVTGSLQIKPSGSGDENVRGRGVVTRILLFILVGKICPFWLSFHFSRGQTENPVHRSFFPPKLNGNACYARYQNLRFSPLNGIGYIRKRSYTEFWMPVLQKETPGSVNVC